MDRILLDYNSVYYHDSEENMKVKIGIVTFCIVFIFGYAIYQYFTVFDGKLHIIFCDVGQGDGIYIRTPNGTDIVIDAGRDDRILSCLSSHMPFWDKTIELAFATHPDADHIAGFLYILQGYKVNHYNTVEVKKDTGVFMKINTILEKQRVPVRYLTAGDVYTLSDGVIIKTFWPTDSFIKKKDSDANRYSLVQLLSYKKFDTILNGDIESDILNSIFSSGVGVDVFKLPHHGSRTGIDSRTFTLIKPRLSIISAGKNNSYGHPHQEVISELEKYHLKYLRTDQVGEVEVVSHGLGFGLR